MPKRKAASPKKKGQEEEEEEQFDDEDIEEMKRKIAEMEAEEARLLEEAAAEENNDGGGDGDKEEETAVETTTQDNSGSIDNNSAKPEGETEQPVANDELSIFVGEVDYEATASELHKHFEPCGGINLITIPVDRYSKQPRGFAYIEFVEKAGLENALLLDDSEFRGRKLKVLAKRKNIYGYNASRGRGSYYGRRRGGYRGRGRGGYRRKRRGGYHRRGRGGKFGGYMYESSSLII